MTEFVTMWKNYVNFSDRTTVRGYWMAYLFVFIATIVISILDTLIIGTMAISYVWSLAVLLPSLAMMVRRLRDAGKHWALLFLLFIPIAGLIIVIVLLCKPSIPDNGVKVV